MKVQKTVLLCLLLAVVPLLSGCKQNPSEEQLFSKVMAHFAEANPTLHKLENGMRDVPIYNASVWYSLMLENGEEVLVYFDESNRADYLADGIDAETWGCVARMGLRFVFVYQGEDAQVLALLGALPGD